MELQTCHFHYTNFTMCKVRSKVHINEGTKYFLDDLTKYSSEGKVTRMKIMGIHKTDIAYFIKYVVA
jgi:hypothetical protein